MEHNFKFFAKYAKIKIGKVVEGFKLTNLEYGPIMQLCMEKHSKG